MDFAQAMQRESQMKMTENGAAVYDRLNGSLTTLFAQIGALRPRTEREIENKFAAAFAEDKQLATKMLFYAGDVRGGLGERRTFRVCLRWLGKNYPSIVQKNINLIGYFNRFDSLFVLLDTPSEHIMWEFIVNQLREDLLAMKAGKACSLLAKWMPSENATSKKTKQIAIKAINILRITPRRYRKMLSALRKYIDVVEVKMSAGNWDSIRYEAVPSHAMARYSKAFDRRDGERFEQYIVALNRGETKINASTLYPYDLVKQYAKWHSSINEIVEEQWKALPNYISGENNIVVMADVSGSMMGRPMDTSIGLAIYFAERNKGAYANTYMTFTDKPHFILINPNDTLREKVGQVLCAGVGYSTDLEKGFNAILQLAVNNHIVKDEMPKALVVISDMEIDRYMRGCGLDFVDAMKRKFQSFGYTMPKLIFWNVAARNDTFISQSEDVVNISGQIPSVFKALLGTLEGKTSWDIMIETLCNKRYDCIKI